METCKASKASLSRAQLALPQMFPSRISAQSPVSYVSCACIVAAIAVMVAEHALLAICHPKDACDG